MAETGGFQNISPTIYFDMLTTLLLDSHYQPLGIIDWQKAVSLLLQDKAEVVKESDTFVRSVSLSVNVPKVLRLLKRGYEKYKAALSKRSLYLRDKGQCAFCGTRLSLSSFTIDHVIPRSRGGKHTWLNVVIACKPCNGQKGAKTPEEAAMPLLYPPRVPTRMELIRQAIEETHFRNLLKDILGG